MVIYRIDDKLAFDQASVFVLGLVLFCLTILFLRDYSVLQRYRYLIATAGILLLLAPFITRNAVNGAYLSVDVGPISFQPAELAKICIVIFLASYLAEKREMLSVAARRVMGLTIPPLKHFGPLLVVWGAAMLMLVFIRDLGSSLMFFGAFLALLYVATGRLSYVPDRAARSSPSAPTRSAPASPTSTTASTSGSTRSPRTRRRAPDRSSSRCSRRPTAACSGRASVSRCSSCPARSPPTASNRSPTAAASCPRRTPTSSSP